MPNHYVAVQRQNVRFPLIFGVGATPAEALDDAREWAEDMTVLETFPATEALVSATLNGRAECAIVDGVAGIV